MKIQFDTIAVDYTGMYFDLAKMLQRAILRNSAQLEAEIRQAMQEIRASFWGVLSCDLATLDLPLVSSPYRKEAR